MEVGWGEKDYRGGDCGEVTFSQCICSSQMESILKFGKPENSHWGYNALEHYVYFVTRILTQAGWKNLESLLLL